MAFVTVVCGLWYILEAAVEEVVAIVVAMAPKHISLGNGELNNINLASSTLRPYRGRARGFPVAASHDEAVPENVNKKCKQIA